MSSDPFPERIDTVKLFARKGSISAVLPLARLQRFTEYLSVQTGQIAVELRFGADEGGQRLLSGTLDTQVRVTCQRCLQDMELKLHCSLSMLVFDTEEELQDKLQRGLNELPEDRDAVTMPEEGLDVVALIEDELILSLPMVPMHADAACNKALNALKQDAEPEAVSRPGPFAVLAALKSPAKMTGKAGKARKTGKAGKIENNE